MIKNILIILLLVIFSSIVQAQNAWTIYNTTNTPNFPENSVHCIAFDTAGIKWVGTDYGLVSYNDTNWTLYNSLNTPLTDNSIRSIAVDKFNNKWIGTFLGGMYKFDGDTTWTTYNALNSGLPDDFVKTIAFDTSNNIWIGTVIGLVKFDGDTTWNVYDLSNSIFTLTDNIDDIEIDSMNVFRIGTVNGGFLKIVDTVWTLYTIPNGSGIPDNSQKGVTVDNNGLEWLATTANGLVAHPGGFTWNIYNQFTSDMPTSGTTCLVALPNPDRIWVGTYDFGIVRKIGVTFDFFDKTNSPMPDSSIQCIEKDKNGIIWIGTQQGGLVRLDESQLTSIDNVSTLLQPVIFPNPFKNQLTIFYPYSKIKKFDLTDVTGKYLNVIFNETDAGYYTSHLNSLSPGVYFLRLKTSDGKILTNKIIKTN